ncbi:hypothetical protein A9C11_23610 [Pseudomonas citronellolis]|uniref:Uncharacterized protein n=1 Tax=Pseudomonas citronellolis TaxID=53408 RepID=A0A1A9KH74_9PSED|nr:hypothetical protein [Pseudomonas citronellolis]ANI16771.1 hypothetical protein A9C11_23610 [Pseudomonas citronellolis]
MAFFDDLAREMDDAIFEVLGDTALLPGVEQPVLGMFSAPWRDPQVGRLNAQLREPYFVVRPADAALVQEGAVITVQLPAPDGGDYDLVRKEPDGTGLVALLLRPRA